MSAPRNLPPEARRAAWDALWRILLAPHPDRELGASRSLDTPSEKWGEKESRP
jgi:hypothetical protein